MADPWLPHEQDPYVHTKNEGIEGKMVSSLLEPGQSRWDVDLIQDIFDERDRNLIFTIPIQNRAADSWYWRKDKFGQYTVKTAYALTQESQGGVHSSNNSGWFLEKVVESKNTSKSKTFFMECFNRVSPH